MRESALGQLRTLGSTMQSRSVISVTSVAAVFNSAERKGKERLKQALTLQMLSQLELMSVMLLAGQQMIAGNRLRCARGYRDYVQIFGKALKANWIPDYKSNSEGWKGKQPGLRTLGWYCVPMSTTTSTV